MDDGALLFFPQFRLSHFERLFQGHAYSARLNINVLFIFTVFIPLDEEGISIAEGSLRFI